MTGNYFSQALVGSAVAYNKYTGGCGAAAQHEVQLRQWALGEVVTAVCEARLVICSLEEEPGVKADDAGLPKVFTLVASLKK